ncbi:MAG TPA: hypothetical protein VFG68_21160 [Fimbriiglobus sp.]|nr:hypothetical protein [Fimbriiglobus sp.]
MTQIVAPLLLAAFLGAPADCPECCAKKAAPPRLVTQTFAVMDLVTPIPDFPLRALPPVVDKPIVTAPPLPARVRGMILPRPVAVVHYPKAPTPPKPMPARPLRECRADQLMKLVTGMIRPYSWDAHGGPGKISFYEIGGAMVVNNSPEVVAEVQDLLTSLRRLQETVIAVECRLLTVPAGFGRKSVFGDCGCEHDAGPVAFLTADQVGDLMHGVQKVPGAGVMQAPKISLFNGQTTELSCGEVVRTFTTGLDVRSNDEQSVFVPRQQAERLGTVLGLQATLAADRRSVRLAFDLRQSELDGPVELVPVKYMVTPVFEGGSQGVPVPVTQFLQKPRIARRAAKRVVALPDGGTVAVPLGSRKADREVIALLTARVIHQTATEVDAKPCCAAVKESPAAELVAAYRRACAAGRTEEAMRLAMQALAADPACFTGR